MTTRHTLLRPSPNRGNTTGNPLQTYVENAVGPGEITSFITAHLRNTGEVNFINLTPYSSAHPPDYAWSSMTSNSRTLISKEKRGTAGCGQCCFVIFMGGCLTWYWNIPSKLKNCYKSHPLSLTISNFISKRYSECPVLETNSLRGHTLDSAYNEFLYNFL